MCLFQWLLLKRIQYSRHMPCCCAVGFSISVLEKSELFRLSMTQCSGPVYFSYGSESGRSNNNRSVRILSGHFVVIEQNLQTFR